MRQERRAGERRSAIERRRRRAPVAVDKRVVADRRGAPRRGGLAARLLRYIG